MTITFEPLHESHFPLLLKWLETPYIKKWWDHDVTYTMDLVKEKFGKHIHGLALSKNSNHKTYAYIICANKEMIGYIQAYNADDFAQENGLNLSAITGSVCGIDLFIGESPFLHKGWGTVILNEFEEQILVPHFDRCLINPAKDNLTAIKAFTKAGFKIVEQFQTEPNIWMIKDLSLRNAPLPTIQKLIKERYVQAKAVFWAGSVSEGRGTSVSDLDLIIVFEEVAHAYREAFIYNGWPIDAFIHDLDTLQYFCGKLEASDGIPALINMILRGQEILEPNDFSSQAKNIAEQALSKGPDSWTQAQIDKERFLITDILDDIKSPKNKDEQIISAVHLFEPLLQFYYRAQKKWTASGKSLVRFFKQDNPELAEEWTMAFECLVHAGDASGIESAVTKILAPHGSYLWDGFRSDAPVDWRLPVEDKRHANVKSDELEKIHELEIALLKPQVRKDIKKLDRLIADSFYEIGASGKVYDKNNILARLPLEQNYEIYGKVINFEIAHISENLIRANYTLEEKTKRTRRTSIWQRHHNNYQMIFHQGTVIKGGKE